jgi:hypothetical protein
MALALWIGVRISARLIKGERPPEARRYARIGLTVICAYWLIIAWAVISGHMLVWVIAVGALMLLNPLVLVPLYIRRARRRSRHPTPHTRDPA